MVRWVKIAACLAAVSGLPATAAFAASFGQRSAGVRRVERIQPADTAGGLDNASTAATDCEELRMLRDQTAELFRRPLTKQEYESRNFMWLRCRSKYVHLFDMGGTWFGPDSKEMKEHLLRQGLGPFSYWRFKHVRGNWGDAMLQFAPFIEVTLKHTVHKMREYGKVAADRYRRTLYIVDCPIDWDDPSYVTERGAFDDQHPLELGDPDDTVAKYLSPPRHFYPPR